MICPRCNSEITDGTLICPVCGDWCAASVQKEYVDNLKAQSKSIVHNSFRSKLFQAMAILMTITAATRLISCFTLTTGAGNASFNLDLTVIIYILAAIFCWTAHTSSDPNLAAHHLGRVSFFDAANWIIMLIGACFLGLLVPICFALINIGNDIFAEAWGEIEPELSPLLSSEEMELIQDLLLNNVGLLFGILAFVFLIAAAVLVWLCIIHYKRRKYMKKVAESIVLEKYNVEKAPPYLSAIVYAGIGLFGSLTSLSTVVFTNGFAFLSLASTIALDCYLIVSAIWMTQLHKEELANNTVIENESAILNNLIYTSKIAADKKASETVSEE